MTTVRYTVYRLSLDPTLRVIIGAYNQTLAEKFSRDARRIAEDVLPLSRARASAGDWETLPGGGVRAVGVGAGVTGHGAGLLIIDDPVRSREDADSEVYRDRAWDWFRDDLYTRLEPRGAAVLIMTRWHMDDLAGRILAEMEGGGEAWEVLSLPALAEENDPLGRTPGEALCPERYDVPDLQRIKGVLGSYSFSALYQGSPVPREGGMFKWAWFNPAVEARPAEVEARVRYWDTAGTEGQGDYTAGVLMSRTKEGLFWIEDVTRGQWSPARRDAEIRATAEQDGEAVEVWLERETGVAGTERSQATVRALAGFTARFEPVTGDKVHRADPLAAQAEAGNVRMVRGAWNHAYLQELCGFPSGAHDDQVDASSGAFAKLADAAPWAFY
jgi:predicted phage terminase large subunit-like protein